MRRWIFRGNRAGNASRPRAQVHSAKLGRFGNDFLAIFACGNMVSNTRELQFPQKPRSQNLSFGARDQDIRSNQNGYMAKRNLTADKAAAAPPCRDGQRNRRTARSSSVRGCSKFTYNSIGKPVASDISHSAERRGLSSPLRSRNPTVQSRAAFMVHISLSAIPATFHYHTPSQAHRASARTTCTLITLAGHTPDSNVT